MSASGVSGSMLLAVDAFRPSLVARSTQHQAFLAGISAALGYGAGHAARRALHRAGLQQPIMSNRWARMGLLAAAVGGSTPIILRRARQEREAHADWGVPPMRPGLAAAQGAAVAAALIGGTAITGHGLSRAATAASQRVGGHPAVWTTATAAAALGAVAAAASPARRALFTQLEKAGIAPDSAFIEPPGQPLVSGAPGSLIPHGTHAREGARLVHLTGSRQRIESVTGRPAVDPIRVFVGVAAAATPAQRVALAISELQRLGAFERRAILAVCPAGTGYVNPVPVEALEQMTDGDCATVAIQYGVLPSMFSTPLIPEAAKTYRLLIDALEGRGPAIYAYGESLGSQSAQQGLLAEPSRWRDDGSFEGVDAALFVGTPAGAGVRRSAEHRSAIFVVDRWEDLRTPVPPEYRVFLLDHDADPVTRFETSLIWARPDWLAARPRGRGVPEAMRWRPLLTYLQVLFDVARATQPQLGQFQSHGHDYRADLAPLVRAAFAPQASDEVLARVTDELVRSEVRRSQLLAQ